MKYRTIKSLSTSADEMHALIKAPLIVKILKALLLC